MVNDGLDLASMDVCSQFAYETMDLHDYNKNTTSVPCRLQHYRTPSIMFEYEFYPVTVVVERGGGGGLLHFVVRLCAVIGGCVGLARATDYVAHLAQEAFDKWLAD